MKSLEEYIKELDIKYKGPIKEFPIEETYLDESLTCSYPVKNLIKKLKEVLPEVKHVIAFRISTPVQAYIRTSENKAVDLALEEGSNISEVQYKIKSTLDFYGYYLNHVETGYDDLDHYMIYPRFQSKFLLTGEKYLVHFTSLKYKTKILNKGLIPLSKETKVEFLKQSSHDKSYKESLNDIVFEFSHPDKVHFIVGSGIKRIPGYFIDSLFKELGDTLVMFIIDTTKLHNITFGVDPNSSDAQLLTLYTEDNISPDTILKTVELNSTDSLDKIHEFLH